MCFGCRVGGAIITVQQVFTPTVVDQETILRYNRILEQTQVNNPALLYEIDSKLKELYKSPNKNSKAKRYHSQLQNILCTIEEKYCSLVYEQQL